MFVIIIVMKKKLTTISFFLLFLCVCVFRSLTGTVDFQHSVGRKVLHISG